MEAPPFTQDAPDAPVLARHRAPLDALTGIRFFAAALVVIFHSRVAALLEHTPLQRAGLVCEHGYTAVILFFLLSGLILAYTYSGQVERRGSWRRFYEARFARLWPMYFASLLLSSLVYRSLPRPMPGLATLLMVQAWDPWNSSLAGTWNFVCWTLSCEAFFYILFPVVQRVLDRCSKTRLLLFLLLWLAVSVGFDTPNMILDSQALSGWRQWVPLAVFHVPEFFVGVSLGNLLLRRAAAAPGTGSAVRGRGALTWLAALVCLALLAQPDRRLLSLLVVSFAALLFGLAGEQSWLRRLLSTRLIMIGGGFSYAMYLLQLPAKQAVTEALGPLGITSTAVRLALNFAVLLAVSWASFRWLENPARLFLRRLFAGLEERRQAPQPPAPRLL